MISYKSDCLHAGKLTQATAASKALLRAGHWQHASYADLSGCETPAGVCLALQAAFGVPGDSATLELLLAWLRRSELGLMGLIIRLPASLAMPKDQGSVTGPLKDMLQVPQQSLHSLTNFISGLFDCGTDGMLEEFLAKPWS